MTEADLSPFIQNLSSKIRLSPGLIEQVLSAFQLRTVKRRELLIQPGTVARYRIYVLKGAFRSYAIDEKGNDHTIQFAVEDWWISDYDSYIRQVPATQFVEALEHSVVLQIDHQTEETLKTSSYELATLFRLMAERSAAYLARRIVSNLTQDAESRFREFAMRYPDVVRRLPSHVLASYLNMSREFLSKIRHDKVKKNNHLS